MDRQVGIYSSGKRGGGGGVAVELKDLTGFSLKIGQGNQITSGG